MATSEAVLAVSQEEKDLWVTSFQGEVLGEAFATHLKERVTDPEQRFKAQAFATLERCTKELLIPSMARRGISTEPDPAVLELAAAGDSDYRATLDLTMGITPTYIDYYARLRELVAPEDGAVVDLLIAHEMALELFVRRELAGDTERSLQPIKALSHVTL